MNIKLKGCARIVSGIVGGAMVISLLVVPASHGAVLFHSGGTGNCDGCHGKSDTLQDPNETTDGEVPGKTGAMLKGSDPSSTCLLCHEGAGTAAAGEQHHVSTRGSVLTSGIPPQQMTPGGDFAWLKKQYRWLATEQGVGGTEATSPGARHGHNVVAADFAYSPDRDHAQAPGGVYPVAALSCISCHDPHGKYKRFEDGSIGTAGVDVAGSGSYADSADPAQGRPVGVYRMLAGRGYQPKDLPGLPPFTADPPAAVAPALYNRGEAAGDTRVAYGSGMSEWCRNCHPGIHGEGGTLGHPSGNEAKLPGYIIANYNAYIATGNFNGTAAGSATSLVPFEMGTADYASLKRVAGSPASHAQGPDSSQGAPNVMCLTCHRAHASGWDSMTRWNTGATFIVENGRYPGIDNSGSIDSAQGRTSMETRRSYYDRRESSFALYQRSLCNKCHVQD